MLPLLLKTNDNGNVYKMWKIATNYMKNIILILINKQCLEKNIQNILKGVFSGCVDEDYSLPFYFYILTKILQWTSLYLLSQSYLENKVNVNAF